MTATETIGPNSTLQQVLEAFPGARRALFKRYHLGGCSSCAFSPDETLAQLCARSGNLNAEEVIAHIQTSHEQDRRILMEPRALAEALHAATLHAANPPRLLDIRTREEWEGARIEGAILLNRDLMQEILGRWPRDTALVIIDHEGQQALDAAAFFLGHGFERVRCLRGGLDAWSLEVDPNVPRYRME
jgi:rhodanese-related sulfurtransferase